MFTIDKQQLRKLETSIFNRAKTKTTAPNDKYLHAYLQNVVGLFLNYFFNYESNKNTEPDMQKAYVFLAERLEGKAVVKLNEDLYNAKYHKINIIVFDNIEIRISNSERYYMAQIGYNDFYFYIYDTTLEQFCDAIIFVTDSMPRWSEKAEKVMHKVLKERMTDKISSTAISSLIETKMKEAGFEYVRSGNSKTETIKIKITNDQTGIFYLKTDNLNDNLDKIISIANLMREYINDGNKIQIRFKSIYDGLHQYEYEHRFDKYR